MSFGILDQAAQIRCDAIRILIMISKFLDKKSFILDLDKIMLYDFYMKFPNIMILEGKELKIADLDFNGYYSYYHWKPDRKHYQICLGYLVGKRLVIKKIRQNKFAYSISQIGESTVNVLNSNYAQKLNKIAHYISNRISTLSDTKVEENINLSLKKLKDN